MELLLLTKRIDGFYELRDCKGFRISTFKSMEEADTWGKENGYKMRLTNEVTCKNKNTAKNIKVIKPA